MTDKLKIMTDNEIIKAFKDFLIEQVDGYTDHVETGGERYEFIEKELELLKETDNLINRLQAENERLQKELKITRAYIHDNGFEWDLLSYSKRNGG